jgi:DNA-binding NarL/FixJ family response regulator
MEDTDRLCTLRIEAGRRRGLIIALERTAPDIPPFSSGERAALHFMGELISDEFRRRSGGSKETGTDLNLREREVADLVRRGLSNREAAVRLGITEATVKRHLYNVFNKTGVDSRTALVRFLRETEAG